MSNLLHLWYIMAVSTFKFPSRLQVMGPSWKHISNITLNLLNHDWEPTRFDHTRCLNFIRSRAGNTKYEWKSNWLFISERGICKTLSAVMKMYASMGTNGSYADIDPKLHNINLVYSLKRFEICLYRIK